MLNSAKRASASTAMDAEQPFERLLRSVSDGFKVQSPVYFRGQWYTGSGDKIGYYFNLTRAEERDLTVVGESERVQQFLELQRLKVSAA
jgi:hypothetical protein